MIKISKIFGKKLKILSFCLFLFLGLFLGVNLARAAEPEVKIRDENYAAKFVSQSESDPIMLEVGQNKTIIVKFKNVGTAIWDSSKNNYISAYTMEPRNRISEFMGTNWLAGEETAKIEGKIKPGQTGELKIDLKTSIEPGTYIEKFYLASENNTWVKGGYFFLKIKVIESKSKPTVVPKEIVEPEITSSSADKALSAQKVGLNIKTVSVSGGDLIKIIMIFQNTGKNPWGNYQLLASKPATPIGVVPELSYIDSSWVGNSVVWQKTEKINPGEFLRSEFYFRAPAKMASYLANFKLQVDGSDVEGANFTVPVEVVAEAPVGYITPHFAETTLPENNQVFEVTTSVRLSEEPHIRVGIWKPADFVQFRSDEDDYNIFDGNTLIGVLNKGRMAALQYDFNNKKYSLFGGGFNFETVNFIRLSPLNNQRAIFTLLNFEHQVKWRGGSRNFNQYRGAMEYRLDNNGKNMYIINELLFEDYINGIAEASDGAPFQYIKALMVAARSYAYYTKESTSKHDDRNFDVVGTTGDQLYLGYINEVISPNTVKAVLATQGEMVTYKDEVVITPYFGHSNGTTRGYNTVWGGAVKPWLVPVKCKYDKGLKMYGHGVGLSQRDAALKAEKEGVDYADLLKYYYKGTELEKIY